MHLNEGDCSLTLTLKELKTFTYESETATLQKKTSLIILVIVDFSISNESCFEFITYEKRLVTFKHNSNCRLIEFSVEAMAVVD